MRILAFTISFVLAFLLFAVQPMATRMVLPTLGGTPAVWNTVMFTFQLLLLAGYSYAHLLARYMSSRGQFAIHGLLVLSTLLFLPLWVSLATSDALVNRPIPYLVSAFLAQLGLPFFCLAATAPLLQSWVSRSSHPLSATPYVLYSASNLGSFAGLLGYVGIVEPLLDLQQQSTSWSALYIAGMGVLMLTGIRLQPADRALKIVNDQTRVRWQERLVWIGLAFIPSSLSLGVTTYITTDIASIPLLWVIPLSLYLLSFVDAFRTRPVLVPVCQRIAPLVGLAALMVYGFGGQGYTPAFLIQLVAFSMLAFAIHGWLAARQPSPRHLTQFYVCLSVGGALGGMLNGLIAPMLFHDALEYPIMLVIASLTAFILLQRRDDSHTSVARQLGMVLGTGAVVTTLGAAIYVFRHGAVLPLDSDGLIHSASMGALLSLVIYRRYVRAFYACISMNIVMVVALGNGMSGNTALFKDRNFFGVSRVYENSKDHARFLAHDTTMHGIQSLDTARHLEALSYYFPLAGMVKALPATHPYPMAVIGLGVGTAKCAAPKGQKADFFEINPLVKKLAQDPHYFTFLQDCPGEYRILLGDGRIRIGAEPDGKYGVIILDAFSSDSIPGHLLTREAIALYMDKLASGGVLILHTSNRHIDLWPLLGAQAKALGVVAYGKYYQASDANPLQSSNFWVVMARTPNDVAPLVGQKGWKMLPEEGNRPWTDQYINLLPYFKALR